jgi:predicted kinase
MTTTVIILRGLPGSGKTTRALMRLEHSPIKAEEIVVCSADQYFTDQDTGEYTFDPAGIGEAHRRCFLKFLDACQDAHLNGSPKLIYVDNTNIQAHEIAPYVAVANGYHLYHQIQLVWCDLPTALKRNVHRVPEHVILDMYQRLLAERLPPYWNQVVICEGVESPNALPRPAALVHYPMVKLQDLSENPEIVLGCNSLCGMKPGASGLTMCEDWDKVTCQTCKFLRKEQERK